MTKNSINRTIKQMSKMLRGLTINNNDRNRFNDSNHALKRLLFAKYKDT